ncbi:uncharacterized protein LOC124886623 [Capsicum annuum]|uniref:uncharacterized protein LOC124886623 n=1 Tax=Capsicum annuum TaxID=4072 RepID=UPI001FB05B8A|nr:uncharacterized protein LOC124886623 [Capsicum annuum]
MDTLKLNPDFDFHLRCQKLGITHLCFADDLLLFARGDAQSLSLLKDKFNVFSTTFGLKANMSKSQVYFGGVEITVQQSIMQILEYEKGDLPFKYLGMPFSSKKLTISQCMPLVNKITTKITTWMEKSLSYAGRVQLIKAVLFGIQAYSAQLCLLPKKIMKMIEAACRSYLWTGEANITKWALVA